MVAIPPPWTSNHAQVEARCGDPSTEELTQRAKLAQLEARLGLRIAFEFLSRSSLEFDDLDHRSIRIQIWGIYVLDPPSSLGFL